MRDATSPDAASQRFTATTDSPTKPAGWRLASLNQSTTEPHAGSRELKYYLEASPGYSAVHDFERRLSRNGIKMSEATSTTTQSFVRDRGGALSIQDRHVRANVQWGGYHYVSRSEDFAPLEAPSMACFANTRKDHQVEALERQLRQAQTEAKVWKERSEAQELKLQTSYKETMEWRMKYEDLYSAVLRGVESVSTSKAKRGATKSLG